MYDVDALKAEHAAYVASGKTERAAQVAALLRAQGVEVDEPAVEAAASAGAPERAVRGRAQKR